MNSYVNASKIWPVYSEESIRYVRVRNGVANITNKQVLIRMGVPHGTVNGLYNIGMYGELKQIVLNNNWNYPDVDLLEPDFKALKTPCPLIPQVREQLLLFCRTLHTKSSYAVIGRDRIYEHMENNFFFQHPFNLDNEIVINARYLEIVLLTFKDLPVLYLAREDKKDSPLIIGTDWGTCALITHNGRPYGYA